MRVLGLAGLLVAPCTLREVREFVETYHYSHSVKGVKISQCFSVKREGTLVGAVIFGQLSTTAWKKFGKKESDVLELRRLVLLDEVERNAESFVIGKTLRWIKRNLPDIQSVVSYADPAHGHGGIIYKAANFRYLGTTPEDVGFFDADTGKTYHSRALRTKYKGNYKPFVLRLREKQAAGKLEKIKLPGKHCFVYHLRHRPEGVADGCDARWSCES